MKEETTCAITVHHATRRKAKAASRVAVALSMTMIFTSYAVSVFNHQAER